jgi:hypothetical protein
MSDLGSPVFCQPGEFPGIPEIGARKRQRAVDSKQDASSPMSVLVAEWCLPTSSAKVVRTDLPDVRRPGGESSG